MGSICGVFVNPLKLHEAGIEQAGYNLSVESDGLLVEFLRVTYIAEGDLIERIGFGFLVNLFFHDIGGGGDNSSDCVLGVAYSFANFGPEEV